MSIHDPDCKKSRNLPTSLLSEAEAELSVAEWEQMLATTPPIGEESFVHAFAAAALEEVRTTQEMVARGELTWRSLTETTLPTIPDDISSKHDTPKEPVTYEQVTPFSVDEDLGVSPISRMDFAALSRVEPMGKISPPMFGPFVCDELRTPVPTGFVSGITAREFIEGRQRYFPAPLENNPEKLQVEIPVGSLRNRLPVPANCAVGGISGDLLLGQPIPESPAVWRFKGTSTESIAFSLEPTNAAGVAGFMSNLREQVTPKPDEMAYWRAALPLPKRLGELLEQNVATGNLEMVVDLVSGYFSAKDTKTGLSTVRYVCHPALGKLIEQHEDLLPVIATELKVGHCDFQSWYMAAILRGYGIAAWATTDILPTPEGTAFNKAFLHARVAYINKQESISYVDTTHITEFDPAYHPKSLRNDTVLKLSDELSKARSLAEKVSLLRTFSEKRDVARASQTDTEREEINVSMREIARAGFAGLLIPTMYDHTNRTPQLQSWNVTLTGATIREVYSILSDLTSSGFGLAPLGTEKSHQSLSPLQRLQYGACLKALTSLKVPMLINWYRNTPQEITDASQEGTLDTLGERTFVDVILNDAWLVLPRQIDPSCKTPVTHFTLPVFKKLLVAEVEPNLELLMDLNFVSQFVPDGTYKYREPFRRPIKSGVLLEVTSETTTKRKSIVEDLAQFAVEFQRAMVDSTFRNGLIQRLQISRTDFTALVSKFVKLMPLQRRVYRTKTLAPNESLERCRESTKLPENDQRRLTKLFLSDLARLDQPGKQIQNVDEDLRKYQPGDDVRRIHWPLYARHEKLYVAQSHSRSQQESSPVFVVMSSCSHYDIISYHKCLALINALKTHTTREIFLGTIGGSSYLELTPELRRQPAWKIFDAINDWEFGKTRGILAHTGNPPPNVLVASDSVGELLATTYLFKRFGNQTKVHGIWLNDKKYDINIVAREEWVRNGFRAINEEK